MYKLSQALNASLGGIPFILGYQYNPGYYNAAYIFKENNWSVTHFIILELSQFDTPGYW